MQMHHEKCWTGWSTSWNQDSQEKYQWLQICRWHHPLAESEELKSLLMKVKEDSEIFGLKCNIQRTKIMACRPITSGQKDLETVTGFILGGSKITADGDCSHEIKRRLLLGWKVITNLESILKIRHYFADKCPSSQSYGFSSGHVWLWELDH